MTLKDKVAMVTGGGSGLGEAAAKILAREGVKVAIVEKDEKDAKKVADEINKSGGNVLVVAADISKSADMEKAVKKITDQWKRLDIVFANAGINGVWAPIEELNPEDWQKTIDTNLSGTFYTIKYATPFLKKNGGSVIVTSSVNGTRIFSNTGATAYSSTKAAQVALAKMLALELAKHRVRVNVICPGAIETNIDQSTEKRDVEKEKEPAEYPEGAIPLTDGKPGQAEDVGELVLFLASDASKHITGTEMWIDGGESLLQG
jgi:NAD(P)-dependent dehydrogenase (short-subunit alcohol dehydrogenase family)